MIVTQAGLAVETREEEKGNVPDPEEPTHDEDLDITKAMETRRVRWLEAQMDAAAKADLSNDSGSD
jgi:hypothetical protein